MRNLRLGLTLASVVIVVLLSGIPLFHAHDTSASGLYSAQCALCDLGGQVTAPPLSTPAALRLDATPIRLPLKGDEVAAAVVTDPASARAPPQQ